MSLTDVAREQGGRRAVLLEGAVGPHGTITLTLYPDGCEVVSDPEPHPEDAAAWAVMRERLSLAPEPWPDSMTLVQIDGFDAPLEIAYYSRVP